MISKDAIAEIVSRAIREDVGALDITSTFVVPASRVAVARIVAKSPGVLCGIEVARDVFQKIDRRVRFRPGKKDGAKVRPGQTIAEIRGAARSILTAERTALNFLQRLSGIATITQQFVHEVRGTRAKIYDTRKTTPGLRNLEKYAVRCGGGFNHRVGLYDAVLIKENHLALAEDDLESAIRKARKGKPKFVEVEAQTLHDVEVSAKLPIDIVMLDNFTLANIRKAVKLLRKKRRDLEIEVSGGVSLRTVRAIAKTGVDRISVGALTHSAPALDYSLDVVPA